MQCLVPDDDGDIAQIVTQQHDCLVQIFLVKPEIDASYASLEPGNVVTPKQIG